MKCNAKCPGKPFRCVLDKDHEMSGDPYDQYHEDTAVNVGGQGWTWHV